MHVIDNPHISLEHDLSTTISAEQHRVLPTIIVNYIIFASSSIQKVAVRFE